MKILDIPRSGSYAGVTSSHNRAGQYVRNRRTPTNNPTARRTFMRSAVGAASSAFSGLTSAQQAAWQAYADAHPVTDRLGTSIKLTGHQMFVAINAMAVNVGEVAVDSPPLNSTVFSASGTSAVFTLATGLVVTFSGLGSSDDYQCVGLSKPVPGGRSFWNTFTQTTVEAGDAVSYTITTADYGDLFGTPQLGQKVFIRVTPVNGYFVKGVPVVISATVAS